MTTDHLPKLAAYAYHEGDRRYVVGGIAKGSGMIAPSMATMLAFIATDAEMTRGSLHEALVDACDDSFNMISVDGDMSTNDSCYACAMPGDREASPAFRAALRAVCRDLAVAMVRDGEGRGSNAARSRRSRKPKRIGHSRSRRSKFASTLD